MKKLIIGILIVMLALPANAIVTRVGGVATESKQDAIIADVTDIPNVIGTSGSTGPTKVISIAGTDENGVLRELLVDPENVLITTNHHLYHNHIGAVFQLSSYLGDIADGNETNILLQIGANKDCHLLSTEAITEGFWELEIFEGPEFTAAGTSCTPLCSNRFVAGTSDVTCTTTPTLVATTVDANSGASEVGLEKVLNVTATTNFVVGTWVLIEKDTEHEFAQIASIQAGVSLTMESDIAGSYVNTDTVETTGQRLAYTHTEGGTGPKKSGAGAGTGGEWVLKSGEDYLFRMTNKSGGASRASNTFWWVEKDKQT